MEIAEELWTPPLLVQEGNSFFAPPKSSVCGSQGWGQVHVPKSAIQNMNCFSMRLRSDGALKGCDQPESHLNRKECATATGLQTWYQLPVQSCVRKVKNRNRRKKKGGGNFFFHCEKGKSRKSQELLSEQRKERMEDLVSLPTKQHFWSGYERQRNDWTVLHHPLTCWSQWDYF